MMCLPGAWLLLLPWREGKAQSSGTACGDLSDGKGGEEVSSGHTKRDSSARTFTGCSLQTREITTLLNPAVHVAFPRSCWWRGKVLFGYGDTKSQKLCSHESFLVLCLQPLVSADAFPGLVSLIPVLCSFPGALPIRRQLFHALVPALPIQAASSALPNCLGEGWLIPTGPGAGR